MITKIFLYVAVIYYYLRISKVECVDPCVEYKSCRSCVRAYPSCQWCASDNFNNTRRCVAATAAMTDCFDIKKPKGYVKATKFHDYSSNSDNVTQIKPQRYKIKLRPGESQTFNFSFKAAKDYPADLYFLLDSSNTMKTILSTTADASEQIYEEMKKKTKNVLLGMGTFIDKDTAPFVKDRTGPVNSFSHKLPMTNSFLDFKRLVNFVANNTGINNDLPEGGFDAISQVITCKEEIGWRNASRKLVFFITDAISHTAGDGKLAGIVYPYDGKCYTKNGVYTKELEMDYPSIGIISELAIREGVNIIFIVESTVKDEYNLMKNYIRGSRCLVYNIKNNKVTFEESNLQKLLTEIYEEITQSIKLEVNMAVEDVNNIKISFYPQCDLETSTKDPNCIVPHGDEKHFQGNITLLRYYEKDNITLDLTIGGIKEKVTLEIVVADCDCNVIENSPDCSSNGAKICGVCECNENRTGRTCECSSSGDKTGAGYDDEAGCKPHKDKDELTCNGDGTCICGVCQCNKGRAGEFCECSSDSCVGGCNGHGKCYCGKCACDKGWSGSSCQCHEISCKLVNGKPCNGRGDCKCGTCRCHEPENWDARNSQNEETCQMMPCTDCHQDQCMKLRECAICRMNIDLEECSSICRKIRVEVVQSLDNITSENALVCENMQAELGCYTRFQYQYDDINYGIQLLVQTKKDCIESYYMWGGGVLLTLLLVGLLTLVAWKVLTELRDRREYQRFLKLHRADADAVCQNPIYEPATTTIRNPAFRRPSVDFTLR